MLFENVFIVFMVSFWMHNAMSNKLKLFLKETVSRDLSSKAFHQTTSPGSILKASLEINISIFFSTTCRVICIYNQLPCVFTIGQLNSLVCVNFSRAHFSYIRMRLIRNVEKITISSNLLYSGSVAHIVDYRRAN